MTELARSFRIDGGSFDPTDTVDIEQLFKKGIREDEERLMLAVLQDAVECFQENVLAQSPWEEKLFQEAENWILKKNTDWLFSFENICETLQLNPDYIRQGLRVWKEAQRKSHSAKVNVETTRSSANLPVGISKDSACAGFGRTLSPATSSPAQGFQSLSDKLQRCSSTTLELLKSRCPQSMTPWVVMRCTFACLLTSQGRHLTFD
jgi:hypothetical protein